MKKSSFVFTTIMALGVVLSVASCGQNDDPTPAAKFNFNITLLSGRNNVLYVGETDKIEISETNADSTVREYTYTITYPENGTEYLTVANDGVLTPLKETPVDSETGQKTRVTVRVTEKKSNIRRQLSLDVTSNVSNAIGGYNWASSDIQRLTVLGELEKYAMENYLTGITLFENGGFVRYANKNIEAQEREDDRVVHLGTEEYVNGFGFGLLSDGYIEGTLKNGSEIHPTYMHTATASDPSDINAWDATGSQVGDLFGYISTSYWGTRLATGGENYEWYPILAKDKVGGKDFTRPIAVYDKPNSLNMYKKWKIYLKTGKSDGLAYRTVSTRKDPKGNTFDGRLVKLEDYLFTYQMLLSEPSQLVRGSELAGDTTYGIKGGQAFFRRSKDKTAAEIDVIWNSMIENDEIGLHVGEDENGEYITIELVNPIDDFTAMYTLSGNLYTPMPREFVESLADSGSYIDGVVNLNRYQSGKNITENVLCLGPYMLESWEEGQSITFKRNDNWYEVSATKYRIPGVFMKIYTSAGEKDDYIYNYFLNGELDSTGIPSSRMSEKLEGFDYETKGDSTFKLNVNSCTQERWNELFGKKGSIKVGEDNAYEVKPWMGNKNFLNGLFWSINRKAFAEKRGVAPSINYFSNAYLSDPQNGISYNSTDQHQAAIANFHDSENENYGFDKNKATTYFRLAVNELVKSGDITLGTANNPTRINIKIMWMYQSNLTEYGEDIVSYFTTAFNDPSVCGGCVVLDVEQGFVTDWQQIYNDYLMSGKYDLGFGAISGNTYNPLNFLEVLKSDNSSGFTLNWGADTGKVDSVNPIVHTDPVTGEKSTWSFDALWAAADHGTVVVEGENVDPISSCYLNTPKDLRGAETNNLYDGCVITIPTRFVDPKDKTTELEISKVQLYLIGFGSYVVSEEELQVEKQADGSYLITITLSQAKAAYLNSELVTSNKLDEAVEKLDPNDPDYENQVFRLLHPFTYANYNGWWNVEVYYTLSIGGIAPSENYKNAYKSKVEEDQDTSRAMLPMGY